VDWLIPSIMTTIVASGSPLILAEVFARVVEPKKDRRPDATSNKYRKRLRFATVAVWMAFALWYWLDFHAVAAGRRPFVIAIAITLSFIVLFLAFTVRVWSSLSQDHVELQSAEDMTYTGSIQKPLIEYISAIRLRLAYVFVVVSMLFVLTIFLMSKNDIGYRVKGMLMLIAGGCFFFLGLRRLHRTTLNKQDSLIRQQEVSEITDKDCDEARQKASRSFLTTLLLFCAFESAAILTLTLNWSESIQRLLGIGAQLAVGVLGLVGLAEILAEEMKLEKTAKERRE
jgi:hypothetical protein